MFYNYELRNVNRKRMRTTIYDERRKMDTNAVPHIHTHTHTHTLATNYKLMYTHTHIHTQR